MAADVRRRGEQSALGGLRVQERGRADGVRRRRERAAVDVYDFIGVSQCDLRREQERPTAAIDGEGQAEDAAVELVLFVSNSS